MNDAEERGGRRGHCASPNFQLDTLEMCSCTKKSLRQMWILILWKEKHQNDKICYCKDAVWSSTKRDDILKVPCGAFQKQTNDVWVQCVYLKGLEKMLRTFVKLLRLFDLRGLFVTTLACSLCLSLSMLHVRYRLWRTISRTVWNNQRPYALWNKRTSLHMVPLISLHYNELQHFQRWIDLLSG